VDSLEPNGPVSTKPGQLQTEAVDYGDPGVPMTREAYDPWALEHGGRYERIDGVVVAMAPERVGHSRVKGNVYALLRTAVRAAGFSCEVFPDGPAVMVDDSDYQPDCRIDDLYVP
jgi:Uma2 family endonuclease